jgi:hypothetical protein
VTEPITEIKRHLDGRVQTFTCDLLHRDRDLLVVRFHAAGTAYARRIHHSDGFFWRNRTYLMYQLLGPAEEPLGYRFDVCKDVRFSEASVEFTDLLLDVVVAADGTLEVQDEDEVDAAHAAGELTPTDLAVILQTRAELVDGAAGIITEALAEKARWQDQTRS